MTAPLWMQDIYRIGVFFENRRQRVLFFRVGLVSMRTIAEAKLPANGSHASAPAT